MGCGAISAKTQPLSTQALQTASLHHQSQASHLASQIQSALQSLDPKAAEAVVREMQAKHPNLAGLIERLANSLPSSSHTMSLADISGKNSAHGSQHGQHGGSAAVARDLKALLDDIKKKQETASPSDASAGAQGQGQHRQQHPELHMAQDVNAIQSGYQSQLQAYAS